MNPLEKVAASIITMCASALVVIVANTLGASKGHAVVLGSVVLLCGVLGTIYFMERYWESQRRA